MAEKKYTYKDIDVHPQLDAFLREHSCLRAFKLNTLRHINKNIPKEEKISILKSIKTGHIYVIAKSFLWNSSDTIKPLRYEWIQLYDKWHSVIMGY